MKHCTVSEKLIRDGWFTDEKELLPWIMAGKILINDRPARSAGEKIPLEAEIRVREYYKRKYVSKGGLKLESALDAFHVEVKGKTALDCGASTGGFTDCLLAYGAGLVYAVDAGFGQLAAKLSQDERVVNMERTNLSDQRLETLEPKPQLITLDLSYLSLNTALEICKDIIAPGGEIIALIKPIFEVQSDDVRRSGKIDDPGIHREILTEICTHTAQNGYQILGLTNSPVTGNTGTVEYFIHLTPGRNGPGQTYELEIEKAIEGGFTLEKFKKTTGVK